MSFNLIDEQKLDKIFSVLASLKDSIESDKVKKSKKLTESWLDNQEVMDILKISPRTLQSLRDYGTIPFSKQGAKIYYKASDIETYLNKNYNG